MIYNQTFHPSKFIEPPTQEEIYRLPEYFAMSLDEVVAHDQCPSFLKRILFEFPWDGRPSVLQIRPQDFRQKKPDLLGDHWHTDVMVRLNDGRVRVAKSSYEFHLMVCSWGDVTETEFISTPMDMPDMFDPGVDFSPMQLLTTAQSIQHTIWRASPGQLVEYTSRDLHRMSPDIRLGRLRLMIVAFNCDHVPANGIVIPSIAEKESGVSAPKFSEYVR